MSKKYSNKFLAQINKMREKGIAWDQIIEYVDDPNITKKKLIDILYLWNKRQQRITNRQEIDEYQEEFKSKKGSCIIAGFQPGDNNLCKPFMNSLVHMGDHELILLPGRHHNQALHEDSSYCQSIMEYSEFFSTDVTINKHLRVIDAYLNPQQIDPLTGLHHLRGRDYDYLTTDPKLTEADYKGQSIIVGHPRQFMQVLPNGYGHPRALYSTGSVTFCDYRKERIGRIAQQNHVIGALVVDIENDKFWVRQLQGDPKTGVTVDLGIAYYPDGKSKPIGCKWLELGDLHAGYTDMEALNASLQMIDRLKPKYIGINDMLDCSSISHHNERKILTRSTKDVFNGSLEKELDACRNILQQIYAHAKEYGGILVIKPSNHTDHLDRYLDEFRFKDDKQNTLLSLQLCIDKLKDGHYLRKHLDPDNAFIWLNVNESFMVDGVEQNCHGHLGVNGKRGNKIDFYKGFYKVNHGHNHSPYAYNGVFCAGTLSNLRLGYNNGLSTWMHANIGQYEGGYRQILTIIDGKSPI